MENSTQNDLDQRRDEIVADLTAKITGVSGTGAGRRPLRLSRIRLRTLVLPAFAVFLMVHFGGGAAKPLGVEAAFVPGSGEAFAGVVQVDGAAETMDATGGRPSIPVESGDVVGTTAGSPGTLRLGPGSLELHAGARALVESLLPPRVRLISGTAIAKGELRVLTAHGLLAQTEGESELGISPEGLRVTLRAGEASLVSPDGSGPLAIGEQRLVR